MDLFQLVLNEMGPGRTSWACFFHSLKIVFTLANSADPDKCCNFSLFHVSE